MNQIRRACAAGYERLASWADLLDEINVFPVADGDTGVNLRVSLAPLRDGQLPSQELGLALSRAATGNSGNIACAFFRSLLLDAKEGNLAASVGHASDTAWRAVAQPKEGTMLSFFRCLADTLEQYDPKDLGASRAILQALRQNVRDSAQILPELRRASVVDAGALGMFLFFEGFFQSLSGDTQQAPPVEALFPGLLHPHMDAALSAEQEASYCVSAVLERQDGALPSREQLAALGDSLVLLDDSQGLKLHLHTSEPAQLKARLGQLGQVRDWTDERMVVREAAKKTAQRGQTHVVTDAAGSVSRELAREYGLSLLDSYVIHAGNARPETLCQPEAIYQALRRGEKVSTAQASLHERHQHYDRIRRQYDYSLYLCVGSFYTGNYAAASAWAQESGATERFQPLDTGAASGRLGLIALLAAKQAAVEQAPLQLLVASVEQYIETCKEYVFIDDLRYLAASGRVSRASGFLGGMLHLKPVIIPGREGIHRVAVLRSREAQLLFALDKIAAECGEYGTLLLQCTDNAEWLRQEVAPRIQALRPQLELILAPLSLTSGVHMGPGTWSLAFYAPRAMAAP